MNNYKHIFAGAVALLLSTSLPATADEVDPGVYDWGWCSGKDSAGTERKFVGGKFPITIDSRQRSMNACFNTYVGGHSLQDEFGFYGYCETTGRTIAASMRQQGISSCDTWLQDSIAKCKQFVSEADDLCYRTLLGKYQGTYHSGEYPDGSRAYMTSTLLIDSYHGRGRFNGNLYSVLDLGCDTDQRMNIQVSPQTREIYMESKGPVVSYTCDRPSDHSMFKFTEFGQNLSGVPTDGHIHDIKLRKQ